MSPLAHKKSTYWRALTLTKYHPKKRVPAFFEVKTVPTVASYIWFMDWKYNKLYKCILWI